MLVLITPPATEPVTVADAKLHLKVDVTDDDTLITALIAGARQYAEAYTGRSFITQTWRLVMDDFPCCIELERAPVQQVTSITYRDLTGATQTVGFAAASNSVQRSTDGTLVADLSDIRPRIAPAFGAVWPIPMPEIGAVAVNYIAGYGNAAAVPEGIKNWILMRVASLYANREEFAPGIVSPLPYVDGMLDPFRVN